MSFGRNVATRPAGAVTRDADTRLHPSVRSGWTALALLATASSRKIVRMFAGFDYSSLSDAELAQQIVGARPGAAQQEEAELFRRFSRPVRLYGLRHLNDGHAAADLVQSRSRASSSPLASRH